MVTRAVLIVREVMGTNHTKTGDVNQDCTRGTISPKPKAYLPRFGVVLCDLSNFPHELLCQI